MRKSIIFLLMLLCSHMALFCEASAQKKKKTANKPDSTAKHESHKPQWVLAGLADKPIHAIGVSRVNKNIILAANDEEGVFRSTNSGVDWELVDKSNNVTEFFFERMRPNIVYSILPYSVRRSEDEGKTFKDLFVAEPKGSLKVTCMTLDEGLTTVSKIVLLGTTKGVFKTLNLKDFQSAGLKDMHINSMAVSIIEGKKPTIYAATPNGIYTSENYGLSWSPIVNGIPQTNILQVVTDIKKPSNVYAVTESNGIFRSTDGGQSWTPTAEGISQLSGFRMTSTVDATTNRSFLYMTNYSGETYISEDEGKSFKKIGEKLDVVAAISIGLSSVAPTTIYVGTLKGIFKYEP